MTEASQPTTEAARMAQRRFARLYSDGSFNVGRDGDDEAAAISRLSGSSDDNDTQLVEVEVRVIRWLAHKGLSVVNCDPLQALQAIADGAGDAQEIARKTLETIGHV